MKKIVSVLVLGLSAMSVSARGKILISATGGLSKPEDRGGVSGADGVYMRHQSKSGYLFGLSAGTEIKKWRIEAGLQYHIVGFKCTGMSTATILPDPTPGAPTWTITYPQLSIPVKIGYVGSISKNFRVIPTAGLMTSYNLGRQLQGTIPQYYESVANFAEHDGFETKFTKISLSGSIGVNFERSIGPVVSVFAGPSFQFMLSGSEHPHSLNLAAGLSVRL